MSWPANYGRLWGQIPSTAGQVFWVAPGSGAYTVNGTVYDASDGNDGLDPGRALATIDAAWNAVTANAGDVIVLLPGSHSPSASIAADVAGVTMMGLPAGAGNYMRQRTSIGAVTSDQTINVTAADIEIAYLHFVAPTTDSAIDISADGDRCHIHNCSFDMFTAAADTGTIAIDFIGAADHCLIDHCYFECDAAQGPAIAAGAATELTIEDFTISQTSGTWAAAITQAAAGRRMICRRGLFHVGNGTMTVGVLGTTGGEVSMAQFNNLIFADSVTTAIDTYDAGDCEVAECYQSGLGACDGGALIVVTT